MAEDVKVLVETFELLKEALPAMGRFPRTHRFTVGERLETRRSGKQMTQGVIREGAAPARSLATPAKELASRGKDIATPG